MHNVQFKSFSPPPPPSFRRTLEKPSVQSGVRGHIYSASSSGFLAQPVHNGPVGLHSGGLFSGSPNTGVIQAKHLASRPPGSNLHIGDLSASVVQLKTEFGKNKILKKSRLKSLKH